MPLIPILFPVQLFIIQLGDFEIRITKEQRNIEQLKTYIRTIWNIITDAEDYILEKYPSILLPGHPTASIRLPKEIHFLTAQQLHDEFPNESIHGRENKAVEKYGAIFIMGMGWPMSDGSPAEEQRSPSYDDWNLNVSSETFCGMNTAFDCIFVF